MNVLKRIIFIKFRIWKYKILSNCSNVVGKPKVFQPVLLNGNGKIVFGKNVQIGVLNSPNFYSHYTYLEARNEESSISIGDNTSINNSFSAVAFSNITIENDVLIGVNCSIMDTDGHNLEINDRNNQNPISKNVFIGDNVAILKGVTIGENSVIGNGSIVTKNIPRNVIASGNPANIIRNL
jgi:galactoside O-acetyltransferase